MSAVATEASAARTLRVAAAGTLLVLAAFTTVLTSLSDSAEDLHASASAQTWALSGMGLGLAAALLATGALADAHGRRRTFATGAIALAVATALAGVAWSPAALVAGRVLQGVGGAAVLAASLGLIGHAFPAGPARTRATGVWGAMVGAGIAVGPLLAGLLSTVTSWRIAYLVEAGAAVALVIAARGVEESRADVRRPVDAPGVALLGAAMAALVAASVEGRGDWSAGATALLLAGLVLLAAFGAFELRRAAPVLDPRLLAQPAFVASLVGALSAGIGAIACMSFLPTFLQRELGADVLLSAVVLCCWSVPSVVVAWHARRLPARFDARVRLLAGTVVVAAGLVALTGLHADSSVARAVPGLLVTGVGSGLVNASLGRLAVESVPRARAGMGSAANNTARYLGSAVGVAIVVAVVTGFADGPDLAPGWDAAALVGAGLSLLGAVAVACCRPRAGAAAPA